MGEFGVNWLHKRYLDLIIMRRKVRSIFLEKRTQSRFNSLSLFSVFLQLNIIYS